MKNGGKKEESKTNDVKVGEETSEENSSKED
jgi:hypothetical protein